jgi:hypothetical protein
MSYTVNQPTRVEYQAAGGTAGLTVSVEILDENGFTDTVNFPVFALTEMPLAGGSIYQGTFTPDEVGIWTARISDSDGGSIIKQYIVKKDIENLLIAPAMVA